MKKKHVIYIIGAGRSGTTLLDVALGNADNVFSCGELNRYPVREGIPTGFHEMEERTTFWRRFTAGFAAPFDLKRQATLHDEFEYHKGLVKRLLGWGKGDGFAEYQRFLRSFYTNIFETIEEEVIVDSSKYPGRALNLSDTLVDCEISYIYIKRDPISVVQSFAKKDVYLPPKGWFSANLYYFLVNHLCRIAIRRLRRKHRVVEIKYEDFIQQPEALMDRIQQQLDLDLTAAINKIRRNEYLAVGELFEGNSMRINERIKLRRGHKPHPKSLVNRLTRVIHYPLYN